MKLKNLISLILVALLFTVSCKKEIIERNPTDLARNYALNETEQRFFDLQNSTFLLERTTIKGRSGFPASLLRVYNDMLASNDEHHFVNNVVERIGYAFWEGATVDISYNSDAFMVNIPFIKPNETSVQAILSCWLTTDEQDQIRYSIESKKELDAIVAGTAAPNPGSCRTCLNFSTFNKEIYGEQIEDYDDLLCQTCFPDDDGNGFNKEDPITERSCQTTEVTYCIYDEPTGPLPTIITGTGGGGGTSGDWVVYNPGMMPGDFVFVGSFGGSSGGGSGGSGGGGGIDINLGGIISGIGNIIKNIINGPVKCPKFNFTGHGEDITTRTDEIVYACQTFTTITCLNSDGWWEIVESWPCPECDGNLTMEEYHGQLCQENTLDFMAEYDISPAFLKQAGVTFEGCCEEGEFDEECGLKQLIEKKLGPLPECADIDLIISSINRENYRQLIANQLNSQTALTNFLNSNSNNDPTNPNVYFNYYGYHGVTQLVNGEWVHSRWNHYHQDEEQLVYRNGAWEPYYPSPNIEMHTFTAVLNAMKETGHVVLECGGMFPGLGEIADGINAVWYFAEGDYVNGTLSSLAMIPFAGNAVTIGKWSRNALKWVKNAGVDFFVSPKGLKYLKSSNVDRVGHVFEHVTNNTAKPKHGVFDDPNDVIGIIDEAWQKKLNNGIEYEIDEFSGNWNYIIDLQKRVGWEGGYNGAGPSTDAKKILIAVKPYTVEVVTAFPKL